MNPIILLITFVAASACSSATPTIQAGEDESMIIDDTLMMCARMGDGRTGAWTQPVVRSETWRRLARGADSGDMKAYEEIIYWMKKSRSRGPECTDETIEHMVKRIRHEKRE